MKLLMNPLRDVIYPKTSNNDRVRNAVRGIILNEKDEIFILYINGEDCFGKRNHFELPGGGIKTNETDQEALSREIEEELGYKIEILAPVGEISMEYNLLNRWDRQHYYLARIKEYVGSNLEEYEKMMFGSVKLFHIDEIVDYLSTYQTENVGVMIHQREICALKEAIRVYKDIILTKNENNI